MHVDAPLFLAQATLDSAVTEPENRIVTEKATYCCCMVKEVQVGKGPDPNAKSSLTRTLKATHPSKGAPYAVVWKAKV